jgi:hypothetical protein
MQHTYVPFCLLRDEELAEDTAGKYTSLYLALQNVVEAGSPQL